MGLSKVQDALSRPFRCSSGRALLLSRGVWDNKADGKGFAFGHGRTGTLVSMRIHRLEGFFGHDGRDFIHAERAYPFASTPTSQDRAAGSSGKLPWLCP